MSTATLHIEKKMTSVPKLRFLGFEGEWKENTTKIQIIAGNAYSLNDYKDNGVILIQGLNIAPGRLDVVATNYIAEDNNSKHVILSKGDILLGLNRPVTNGELKVCRYNLETKGYLYQRAGKLQFNFESIYPDLLYQYLRSDNFLKDITNELVGSDQPYIRSNLFEIVCLTFPTLPEQQKIASFLSAVDEKVQQLSRKKELLSQYKKGVMQQLFSGKLRFKDENGKNYADWEEIKLGKIMSERNDQAPKSEQYPLMAFIQNIGVAPKGERYNREFLVNNENGKKYKKTEFGDFIYSSNNLETGSIGLNRYGSASISPVYSIFKIKELCDFRFIFSYLVRKSFINKMISFRQGVVYGQWRIHESDFLMILEKFPCLEEQQKIANFLSSIDAKIESTSQQINQMQSFKKGLLQQLFV